MKYIISLLLFVFLLSCEKFSPVSENTTKVVIHIDVPPDEVLIVRDNPYDFNYEYETVAGSKINKDFIFEIQFDLKQPEVFQLRTKRDNVLIDRLYLYPNDELKISIDNTNSEDVNVTYEGKSAKANSFVKNIKEQYKKDQDFFDHLNNSDAQAFIEWADKRHDEMLDYYKNYFFKDSVPDIVNRNEISNINFDWAYIRIDWTLRHFFYKPDNWNTKIIPDNYYSFLKELNIIEPYLSLFLSQYLESLIWEWHISEVQKGVEPTAQNRETAKFHIAKQKFFGESADIAMSLCLNDLLVMAFDERMMGVINQLLDEFKVSVKNKNYLHGIEKLYKKRLSLMKGLPAPDFTLPNLFNAPISLKDFKGKTVYCYFWSTQYEPSREMAKFLNQIQIYNLRNPNISFISVAMEEDAQEKWKRIVEADTLTGIQLYSEGLFANKVAIDYMINSIPFAFIVDKDGKIAMMNAPFPTDNSLINILTGYMSK